MNLDKIEKVIAEVTELANKADVAKSHCELMQRQLSHSLKAELSDEEVEKCRQNVIASFEACIDFVIQIGRKTKDMKDAARP